MADRIKGLTVSFDHDIHKEDCKAIIDAIKMIKGVEDVEMHVIEINDWFARKHVKSELREMIANWLQAL